MPDGKSYNYIDISIDTMHLMGIVKRLLTLWTDSKYSKHAWSISKKIKEVDEKMLSLRLPHIITRRPRSIEKNLKYFKAYEFRNFLLYYGPAILPGILPDIYLAHFLLLSTGFRLGLGLEITEADLQEADFCFQLFYYLTGKIYGLQFLSINIHLLIHLSRNVRRFGPFWTLCCYVFEDMNSLLLSNVSGTRGVALQMIYGISMLKQLEEVVRQNIDAISEKVLIYLSQLGCDDIIENVQRSNWNRFNRNLATIGAPIDAREISQFFQSLLSYGRTFKNFFLRIALNECLFHSAIYDGQGISNSFTVTVADQNKLIHTQILCYAITKDLDGEENLFAICVKLKPPLFNIFPHLKSRRKTIDNTFKTYEAPILNSWKTLFSVEDFFLIEANKIASSEICLNFQYFIVICPFVNKY
eukprot:Pompholyxophrys_sp_v1_NODE_180_length_1329_cov_2.716641.p1 type:complete len:414 gc:universal NODE_180_length_1329_cov_2.716641:1266-25(-)